MPHLLKSLELQGYKTFASRTVFEFAGTVTAIVGPNGSGKSNVVDSLRWVLGEQSYSLLRGKRTADMIFSGSEHRAQAGMAAATVTFDNSSGWLPIDFSEVSVTRRAYRDGQNEYLINGQRVRLRDVSELLAQSGLAERTYTFIGQGVVDAALALKAEERRRLFEEAAGIGLHRTRRQEALRRLDTTRRNLDRVQDIMAELKPRLRYLDRQARRAREHAQVKADLQVLLREWYGYHWHHAQRQLAAARDYAQGQEAALQSARKRQAELDQRLNAIRGQAQGLRGRLNAWHRQLAELHTRREVLNRERAVAAERRRALQEQESELQATLLGLEEELARYRQREEAALQDVTRQQSELQAAQNEAAQAQQALAARLEERRLAQDGIQAARESLAKLHSRQSQLQARLAERQAQAGRQQLALQKAAEALGAAQQTLSELRKKAQQAQAAQEQAAAEKEKAAQALSAHQARLAQLEEQRSHLEQERSARSAEKARLAAELEVLEQAEAALQGYSHGAQLLLKAARRQTLPGAQGALSSQLHVDAQYESAIAAALGEYLDALVLDKLAHAGAALSILEGAQARAALLPLDVLAPPTQRPAWSDAPGVIGLAADLVQAPPSLRPALDLLLGSTLVVQDRENARQVISAAANRSPDLRAVTLAGEVFFARGPVLAGQERAPATLSRPRQRKLKAEALAHAAAELEKLDDRLAELGKEIEGLQQAQTGYQQALAQAQARQESALHAYSRSAAAVEQAGRQVEWQSGERSRIQENLEQGGRESTRLKGELAQIAAEISQAEEALRVQARALSALPLEEFQESAAYWKTQAAVAERAVSAARSRLEDRRALVKRSAASLESLRQRRDELERAFKDLQQQQATQGESEIALFDEIKALQDLIEPAEAELQAAEKESGKLQQDEARARKAASKAEHNHAQARIALARKQESLDTWRRRIEDDFGLVSFEYEDEISGPTPLPLDGLVEQLPLVRELTPGLEENVKRQRAQLRRMGSINPEAQTEYESVKQRFEFMTAQMADLHQAESDIREVIAELDTLMERELRRTFDAVSQEFSAIFKRLFGGGSARLVLTDPNDMTSTGIDIEARLPGRRSQGLSLLSGGERSLTASSLVFALLKVSPTPFCLLDEVDAMLDEANVGRYRELLRELSENTQFIIVTHNRNTVQVADVIYGITMGLDSVSQVLSLKLDDVAELVDS